MNIWKTSVPAIVILCAACASLSCGSDHHSTMGDAGSGGPGNSTGGKSSMAGTGGEHSGTGGKHSGTGGDGTTDGSGGSSTQGSGGHDSKGTGGSPAHGSGGNGPENDGGGRSGDIDAAVPQTCQVPDGVQNCYQMNAPCNNGRFVFNPQSGACDQVCKCTGAGTFDTQAACIAACIDAVPQDSCSAAGGSCTPDQYSACPSGQEPIYPQPKRDCSGGGHCCVAAPESACQSGTNGAGECLLGDDCISPGLVKAAQSCEAGRVCCKPNLRGRK